MSSEYISMFFRVYPEEVERKRNESGNKREKGTLKERRKRSAE